MKKLAVFLGFCVVLVVLLTSCGGGGGGAPKPPPAPKSFTLTVSVIGTGGGTVTSNPVGINCGNDCSQSYGSGTSVTLTATPDANSVFAGWFGVCSGTGSCVVAMNSNKAVTATFDMKPSGPALEWSREVDFFERGAGFEAVALAVGDDVVTCGWKDKDGTHVAVVARYDSSGNEKWRVDYGAMPSRFNAALRHPSEDSYFLAGNPNLAKFNATGQLQFENNCLTSATVVAGRVFGNNLYLAVFDEGTPRIVKTDLTGKIDCTKGFAVRNSGDRITGLWVASSDRVWAVGDFTDSSGSFNKAAYLRKFDHSGNLVGEEKVFDDVLTPKVVEVVEGDQTFVYFAGTKQTPTIHSFLVVKLDQNGNEIWRKTWNGDSSRAEQANSLYDLVVAPGGVAAVGSLTELVTADLNDVDVGAIAYGPDGSVLWKIRHGDLTNRESAFSAAFDSAGKLILVGNIFSTPTSGKALILKFRAP